MRPTQHFHRDVFSSRLRHSLARETHVIVGDHDPEPRDDGVVFNIYDGVIGHPDTMTRKQGGYGASFDD